MQTIIDTTRIQIVDLPAAFPDAAQAAYAWAQHRGITDSPVLGYAVLETYVPDNRRDVAAVFAVTDYAGAVAEAQAFRLQERDAALQCHDLTTQYVYRVVNVYDFGGVPTIVL